MNSRAKSFCGVPESVGFKTWVVAMRQIALLLLVAGSSLAQDVPAAPSFSITGIVKSGNTPIPGATVTATNSSTQEKTATSTDVNGAYTLQVAGGKVPAARRNAGVCTDARGRLSWPTRALMPTLN